MKFAFLASCNHIKPTIVLKRISEIRVFSPQNTIIITDGNKGRFYDLFTQLGYSYNVVWDATEIKKSLEEIAPDYLICCGWHSILPDTVLNLPKKTCFNCHGSYLPDYKGASPFKHYWSNWEKSIGVTIHIMTGKIDQGNILTQRQITVNLPTTPSKILKLTSELTAEILMEAINYYERGDKGITQAKGRYFYKIPNWKHFLFWLCNGFLFAIKKPRRLTPHKIL